MSVSCWISGIGIWGINGIRESCAQDIVIKWWKERGELSGIDFCRRCNQELGMRIAEMRGEIADLSPLTTQTATTD